MSTHQRDEAALEELLDRQGLTALLGMLGNIAALKAAHARTNWLDEKVAKKWEAVTVRCEKFEAWAKKTGPA